jgi:hypothetical protein
MPARHSTDMRSITMVKEVTLLALLDVLENGKLRETKPPKKEECLIVEDTAVDLTGDNEEKADTSSRDRDSSVDANTAAERSNFIVKIKTQFLVTGW